MAYQGPNVQVRQQFVTSPGQVVVEDLAPTVLASAFDVYAKEKLGSAFGISNQTLPWSEDGNAIDDVIHDETVLGQRALDFYPPTSFANSASFGQIELDELSTSDVTAAGVTIERDDTIDVPGAEKTAGNSTAIIPYYKLITGAAEVNITAAADNVVTVVGGAIKTANVQVGQKVFVTSDGGTSWTEVGVVGSKGNDETKVTLATSYSGAPFVGDGIVIGAATDATEDNPDSFYDPNADFVALGVKPGDIVEFSSLALPGSDTTPIVASIKSVTSNLLKFNTIAQASGEVDYSFHAYQTSTEAPGSTIKVNAYNIKRYLGFSENRGYKLLNAAAGVEITVVGTTVFTIPDTTSPKPLAGDYIAVTPNADGPGGPAVDERDTANLRVYQISSVSTGAGVHTINTDEDILQSVTVSDTAVVSTDYLHVWTPKIETDVVSDFRAIRTEEAGSVKRITSVEDIFTNFVREGDDTISPYNELAFMTNIAFQNSGGKVTYAVNVDASTGSLSTEYTEALEELKLIDSYTHVFGTTDGGVNGLAAPYVLAESDPYQAHEKIAVLAYDQEDVYLMGQDTGSVAVTGIVTLDGAFDPITAGTTIKDTIDVYDASGVFQETLTVTETPTVATSIQTNGTTLYGAGHVFKIKSGRKNDQAQRIASLGAIDERRVAVVWPGWFYGVVNGSRTLLPPYYISAAVAGLDSGQLPSQSFTNLNFSIPGVSSIELETNSYFRKSDLDVIGGAGISVMIQETSTSNSIKSRHDLTTDMSAVQLRERSITKQADVAAKTIRDATSPYVGKYNITPQLLRFLEQVSSTVATTLVRDSVLSELNVVSVTRDEVIDDKINFVFEAIAFIAGNFYDVTLIVKTR